MQFSIQNFLKSSSHLKLFLLPVVSSPKTALQILSNVKLSQAWSFFSGKMIIWLHTHSLLVSLSFTKSCHGFIEVYKDICQNKITFF